MTQKGHGKREVPKVSGLVSMGRIPQPNQETLDRMPTFPPGREAEEKSPANETPSWAFQPKDTGLEVTERGTVLIPVSRLRASPFNARKIRTSERIQEIANSMLADQQREPITVYPGTGEDQDLYMIASGATRHLAAIQLGWKTVEAWIDTRLNSADPLSIVRISHVHNNSVAETDLDHAYVARDLQAVGYTLLQVANALGYKGNRQITRLNAYFELTEAILEVGKTWADKFSAVMAEMLKNATKTIGEEPSLNILRTAISKNLSIRDIENLITVEKKRIARDSKPRTRSTRISMHNFKLNGEPVGTLTRLQTAPGEHRIQLETTLTPEIAEQLNDQLEALLKTFAAGIDNA